MRTIPLNEDHGRRSFTYGLWESSESGLRADRWQRDNIISAAHCATRLRLVIADNDKCDKTRLEEIGRGKGVFEALGQLQIIFGTGTVNKVYDEFIRLAGIKGREPGSKQAAVSRQNVAKRATVRLWEIFLCAYHPGHRSQRT